MALSNAFAQKWEGYVLKPLDDPYLNFEPLNPANRYRSCLVKLKRHYIPGLGDTVETAVVGARRDTVEAGELRAKFKLSRLPFTHFYLGYLLNKNAVLSYNAKPHYQVIDAMNQGLRRKDLLNLTQRADWPLPDGFSNAVGVEDDLAKEACEWTMDKNQQYLEPMTHVFRKPFIFEVKGCAFERPGGASYWILRFPRVLKIHDSRDFKDTISFSELQALGEEAMTNTGECLQEAVDDWERKLVSANSRKICSRFRAGTPDEDEIMDSPLDETISEATYELASLRSDDRPSDEALPENVKRAPPMVRIDTSEMAPGEERASDGGVRSRHCTPDSENSTESAPSPPTSPISLPPLTGRSSTKPQKTAAGSGSTRDKRSLLELGNNDKESVKRPCRVGISGGRTSSSGENPSPKASAKGSSTGREPLHDVRNPIQTALLPDVQQKLDHTLQLIPKALNYVPRVYRRERTRPPIEAALSDSERQTTSPEESPESYWKSTSSQPEGTGPGDLSTQSDFPSSPGGYIPWTGPTSRSQSARASQATSPPPPRQEPSRKKRPASETPSDCGRASSAPGLPFKRPKTEPSPNEPVPSPSASLARHRKRVRPNDELVSRPPAPSSKRRKADEHSSSPPAPPSKRRQTAHTAAAVSLFPPHQRRQNRHCRTPSAASRPS